MSIASVPSLVDALRRHRLLNSAQLAEVSRKLQARFSDPRELAKELVKRGWLTPQQINQLFTGRPPQAAAVQAGIPVAMAVPAYPAAAPAAPVYRRKKSSAGKWLLLNFVGLLVIASLAWFLYTVYQKNRGNPNDDAEKRAEQERMAAVDLNGLRGRIGEGMGDQDRLRRDLLEFRHRYAGLPQVLEAGDLLKQLKSPLDILARHEIRPEENYDGLHEKVVAILGERRSRHWGPVRLFVFAPDGKQFASIGDDKAVRLWGVRTGIQTVPLPLEGTPLFLGFVAAGKNLSVATTDGKVTIWNAEGDKTVNQGPVTSATVMAVSPTGQLAASTAMDGKIILWELATGKVKHTLDGHATRVNALAFSPSGKLLASGGVDRSVRLWDVDRGDANRILDGHEGIVRAVAFSADSKLLASADQEAQIKVWNAEDGKAKATMVGHTAPITSVAFAAQGNRVVSGSMDSTVRVWNPDAEEHLVTTANGHAGIVWSVGFGVDGKTVGSAGNDGSVRTWGAEAGEARTEFAGQKGPLTAVAFSPDCKVLATACRDRSVGMWDLASLKMTTALKAHDDIVSSVAFSNNGTTLATGGWDGRIVLWDGRTYKRGNSVSGHIGKVMSVGFSTDDNAVAVGSGDETTAQTVGAVRVIDLGLGDVRFQLTSQASVVMGVAFSPDKKLMASASADATIKLVEAKEGAEVATLTHGAPVLCAAFSPEGKLLASGGNDGSIKVWDVAERKELHALPTKAAETTALVYAPDGKTLISSHRDGAIILWDAASGSRQDTITLPGPVHGLALANDGRHLATANGNSTAYILRLTAPTKPKKPADTRRGTDVP